MNNIAIGSYGPVVNFAGPRAAGSTEANSVFEFARFAAADNLTPVDTLTRCECSQPSRPMTQLEMNEQARRSYEEAEGQLRSVYHQLAARKGELMPDGQPKEGTLYAAQEAWVKFSEADAKATAESYRGGSIYPLIYLNAKEESTLARTAQLARQLEQMEQS